MFSNQELSEIKNLLQPDKEIVIVTHYNPDGDAIGSSLGLKHALKKSWDRCYSSRSKRLSKVFKMDARSQTGYGIRIQKKKSCRDISQC